MRAEPLRVGAERSGHVCELLELGDGVVEFSGHGIELREIEMDSAEGGIAIFYLAELGQGFGIAVGRHERDRVVQVGDRRERVERERGAELLQRLVEAFFGREEIEGVEIMSRGIVGI